MDEKLGEARLGSGTIMESLGVTIILVSIVLATIFIITIVLILHFRKLNAKFR